MRARPLKRLRRASVFMSREQSDVSHWRNAAVTSAVFGRQKQRACGTGELCVVAWRVQLASARTTPARTSFGFGQQLVGTTGSTALHMLACLPTCEMRMGLRVSTSCVGSGSLGPMTVVLSNRHMLYGNSDYTSGIYRTARVYSSVSMVVPLIRV